MMVPREARTEYIDVAAALDGYGTPELPSLRVLSDSDVMLANLHTNGE
jgi:hypothetical protein